MAARLSHSFAAANRQPTVFAAATDVSRAQYQRATSAGLSLPDRPAARPSATATIKIDFADPSRGQLPCCHFAGNKSAPLTERGAESGFFKASGHIIIHVTVVHDVPVAAGGDGNERFACIGVHTGPARHIHVAILGCIAWITIVAWIPIVAIIAIVIGRTVGCGYARDVLDTRPGLPRHRFQRLEERIGRADRTNRRHRSRHRQAGDLLGE